MNQESPEKLAYLLVVVAGSGWTVDSNNVCKLYSYEGDCLGNVYKYSAYDRNGYMERLQDPGKEITLIKIPKIGIIQTEICRNVSENDFCSKLSQLFKPQFLLTVAWSKSIDIGFKKQFDSIISNNRKTCCVMCNCCAAVSDSRGEIGLIAAPRKKESYVESYPKYIKRDCMQCDQACEKGCFFEIRYNFKGNQGGDVKFTAKFRNKG